MTGPGCAVVEQRQVANRIKGELGVEWVRDPQLLATLWNELLDNKVSANRGLMVSLL